MFSSALPLLKQKVITNAIASHQNMPRNSILYHVVRVSNGLADSGSQKGLVKSHTF